MVESTLNNLPQLTICQPNDFLFHQYHHEEPLGSSPPTNIQASYQTVITYPYARAPELVFGPTAGVSMVTPPDNRNRVWNVIQPIPPPGQHYGSPTVSPTDIVSVGGLNTEHTPNSMTPNIPLFELSQCGSVSPSAIIQPSPPPAPVYYTGIISADRFNTEQSRDIIASKMPLFQLPRATSIPTSHYPSPISSEERDISQEYNSPSSSRCYTTWKRIPIDAVVIKGSNQFVPQTLYKPFTEADQERYLEQVSLFPPIIFVTKGPSEWGIALVDALRGNIGHLVDKDDHVLQGCGPSVSIRINWPGYPPFKRQISSRTWSKSRDPITKVRLVKSLAKTTGQFIEKMSKKPFDMDADRRWRVGAKYIRVEDLVLVSLHHVSKGSWQPHFRLRRDLV